MPPAAPAAPAALARRIVARARAAGITVATAESCTGGMVAAAITAVPGASAVFRAGLVSYSDDAKQQLLGVKAATLAAHGAVSEAVAQEMAEGARTRTGATLAVAVTGIAGPGGSAFKPEGRVCFAIAAEGRPTGSETRDFGAIGRARVRRASRDHALGLIAAALAG
ncbi:MAG: damage-inducible protein CinA [Alphaproteobacteria bacterium HGW-Alphaproteobacteria-6]|nr:MAG: damage-inducible protein CinA [Alphaproteobacteria bacterium HGW-Alphaproteobacteria-6]